MLARNTSCASIGEGSSNEYIYFGEAPQATAFSLGTNQFFSFHLLRGQPYIGFQLSHNLSSSSGTSRRTPTISGPGEYGDYRPRHFLAPADQGALRNYNMGRLLPSSVWHAHDPIIGPSHLHIVHGGGTNSARFYELDNCPFQNPAVRWNEAVH